MTVLAQPSNQFQTTIRGQSPTRPNRSRSTSNAGKWPVSGLRFSRARQQVVGNEADKYVPQAYWEEQHHRADLSAVGQVGLSSQMNEWLYRAVRINIGRFLDRNTVLPVERALDVGTGTGFWASFWHGRGIRVVDGSDLIPDAIKRLRAH